MKYRSTLYDNGFMFYTNWQDLKTAEDTLQKEVDVGLLSCNVDLTDTALDAMARNLYMRPAVGSA